MQPKSDSVVFFIIVVVFVSVIVGWSGGLVLSQSMNTIIPYVGKDRSTVNEL